MENNVWIRIWSLSDDLDLQKKLYKDTTNIRKVLNFIDTQWNMPSLM